MVKVDINWAAHTLLCIDLISKLPSFFLLSCTLFLIPIVHINFNLVPALSHPHSPISITYLQKFSVFSLLFLILCTLIRIIRIIRRVQRTFPPVE